MVKKTCCKKTCIVNMKSSIITPPLLSDNKNFLKSVNVLPVIFGKYITTNTFIQFTNAYINGEINKEYVIKPNSNNKLVVPIKLTQKSNKYANFCFLNDPVEIIVFTQTGLYDISYVYTLSSIINGVKTSNFSTNSLANFYTNIEIQQQNPNKLITTAEQGKQYNYVDLGVNQNIVHQNNIPKITILEKSNLQVINKINNISGIAANNGITIKFNTNSKGNDEFVDTSNTLITITRIPIVANYNLTNSERFTQNSIINYFTISSITNNAYDNYFIMKDTTITIKKKCKLNFFLSINLYDVKFTNSLYIDINGITYKLDTKGDFNGYIGYFVKYLLQVNVNDVIKFYIITSDIVGEHPKIKSTNSDITIVPLED